MKSKIEEIIGESTLRLFLQEIDNGKIDKDTVQMIALEMKVNGVYVANKNLDRKLETIMKHLLDDWFKRELYSHKKDGQSMFFPF